MVLFGPRPRDAWVAAGDRCQSNRGAEGTVLRVCTTHSLPYAVVAWDNGHIGRITITLVRRIPAREK